MDFANFWWQKKGGVDPDTIPGSLRFRNEGSSSSYNLRLSSTNQNGLTPTTQARWTLSVWLKDIKGRDQSAQGSIYTNHYRTSDSGYSNINTGYSYTTKPAINIVSGGGNKSCTSWLNDGTAWAHHVLSVSSNGVIEWYVNGDLWQTLSGFTTNMSFVPRNADFQKMIGCGGNSSAQYWSGFRGSMAQFIFVDGTGYGPEKFGQFDDNGTWVCRSTDDIKSGISFGNCGYCLEFLDPSNLGKDTGPNGIHFTPYGFDTTPGSDTYDLSEDSPSRNICVMQSMFRGNQQPMVEEGGTRFASPGTWKGTISTHTLQPGTGKYYMEVYCSDAYFGIGDPNNAQPMNLLTNPALITGWAVFRANGNSCYADQTTVSSSVPQWANSWTGFTVDTDNNTLKMDGPNGSFTMNYSSYSMANKPIILVYANYSGVYRINHGQQPFRRTQPADTKIVASHTCGGEALLNVQDYFQAVPYSGTGAGGNSVSVRFQPDFIWFKSRSFPADSSIWNSSTNTYLCSNSQESEAPASSDLTVNASGFTHNAASQRRNSAGESYVAWCFRKAPGFMDIVTYTGNGSNRTISHNLGVEPKLIIVKSRTQNNVDWSIYHYYGGANSAFHLNRDSGNDVQNVFWNNTRPTSSVFSLGTNNTVNQTNEQYVAFLFADVPGVMKVGEYMGNGGNPEGVVAHTGFKPAFFLTKRRQDTAGWTVWDSARADFRNQNWTVLYPNSNAAEGGSENSQGVDFLCTGIKQRGTWANSNTGSNYYIYWAVAEHSSGTNMSPVPANNK